jgi:adenylylsulfate kinase-like enzyme
VPVLWITGAAGVGKSTVSWWLFTEMAGSGTPTAFADADQLCTARGNHVQATRSAGCCGIFRAARGLADQLLLTYPRGPYAYRLAFSRLRG